MKSKAVGFIWIALVVLTFSETVVASSVALRFSGRLVNTGCDVRPLAPGANVEGVRLMQVSMQVRLAIHSDNTVCGGALIPFEASYHVASGGGAGVSADSATNQLPHGIVTLTYQ